jgi:hypothetical protein
LQKYVESPLSVKLLAGEFGSGDTVLVDVDEETDDQNLIFSLSEKGTKVSKNEKVEA